MIVIPDQLNIDVMATVIGPVLSSKKLLCKVKYNFNNKQNITEIVCDSILIKITIIAILIMLYSCQMVRIISHDLVHQLCASHDWILIVIFSPFIVLINYELTIKWLCIAIRFIIEWVMTYKLTLAAYNRVT